MPVLKVPETHPIMPKPTPTPSVSIPTRNSFMPAPRSALARLPEAEKVFSSPRFGASHRIAEKLAESPLFRNFQQAFEVATVRSLTLRAVESEPVAGVENDTSNPFCSLLAQSRLACALCRQSRKVGEVEPGPSVCAFGLCATTIGVKVGKEIVAFLQTGQVLFRARRGSKPNALVSKSRNGGWPPTQTRPSGSTKPSPWSTGGNIRGA